ncbi:hypothetical protein A2917_02175 [Candidatus Nomurabacteria bacterium RIFCSPLOWO2_01_FULL_42_17]|uniref:Peptidase A24A N-terminal domain-containing protein n=1 Tax=Candidatus Nomurabacteria bacterium RIFCSPLOWO2_01_FULL_42_17 TaxID=1801780 RepID=A0A1F6XMD1_9BACT|nr:MAG: hypothetical protein A2917_02175 [Candidatus Nomurabacteria bacterium RIFCSPLOWO2_01_FULL_42_17]
MILTFTIIFFLLGLIIGSFLNVVIFRWGTRKSFFESFSGRSACLSCGRQLAWYELIPLFSFLGLKGRCKTCKAKISIQYPLVELATGTIFAFLFFKFSDVLFTSAPLFAVTYVYYAITFSLLLVIVAYDWRHKIIPDILALIFGILAFAGLFLFDRSSWFTLLSGIFTALPFALFWLLSRGRWMGLGDAKLALGIGWLLPISLALSALAIAFWSGAIIGIIMIILSKSGKIRLLSSFRGMKSEIPFAPFLVLGTFLAFIFELNFFNI